MLGLNIAGNDYAMSGGKNNFEKIKNMIIKDDLKKAI